MGVNRFVSAGQTLLLEGSAADAAFWLLGPSIPAFGFPQSDASKMSTFERRSLAESRPNQKKRTNPRTTRKAPSCQRLSPLPVGLSPHACAVHKTAAAKRKQRTPAARAGESPDQRVERISTIVLIERPTALVLRRTDDRWQTLSPQEFSRIT